MQYVPGVRRNRSDISLKSVNTVFPTCIENTTYRESTDFMSSYSKNDSFLNPERGILGTISYLLLNIAGYSLECWIGKKQRLVEEATSLCPICVCIQRSGTRSEVFCCRLDPLFEPGTQSLSRSGESGLSNNSQRAL